MMQGQIEDIAASAQLAPGVDSKEETVAEATTFETEGDQQTLRNFVYDHHQQQQQRHEGDDGQQQQGQDHHEQPYF